MENSLPITVKIIFEKDSSDAPYVAYSPELDIASAGPTEDRARKNLLEAVSLVLKGAQEDGNLDEFLEEAGFYMEKNQLKAPKIVFERVPLPV